MTELRPLEWNLSDLFAGLDDPRITDTLDSLVERADRFAAEYRGKIDSPNLSPSMLLEALREYEDILMQASKPVTYASLIFSANTADPARGAFLQKMRERSTDISVRLMFFELELVAVPEDTMRAVLAYPDLAKFRHYVWAERLFRDHRLSEPEETILEETANTGRRAFTRLFDESVSAIRFRIASESREESLTIAQVLALLRDPDREVRRSAAASLTEGLQTNKRTLTYIFNTLLQDRAVEDRLRKHSYPEEARHLSNQLDPQTVELVVKTAADHYSLVERYYRLKREILGYDILTHYDRYAPLYQTREKVPFEKAKEIILRSFGKFNPEFAEIAKAFFENGWIDAQVRDGKRSGAFCSFVTPDIHPYVLVNYLDRMDDVMTLAHELGHAVHAWLSRPRGYLNFHSVLPMAELASTFGEMIVFDDLQAEAGAKDRLALYAEKIEGSFATIFRQTAMFRFEQEIHARRRSDGELTTDGFGEIWQKRLQEMHGDSVELGEEHKHWWMYISHFVQVPFYVYAYTFGELLVMALYAAYKKEGQAFVPKYVHLLEAGGSAKPSDMLAEIGIDVNDPAFWQGGMSVLEGLIADFENLYRKTAEGSGGL